MQENVPAQYDHYHEDEEGGEGEEEGLVAWGLSSSAAGHCVCCGCVCLGWSEEVDDDDVLMACGLPLV